MNRDTLIDIAKSMLDIAKPGKSQFKVGAALSTAGGKIYSGCNIDATTTLGICAERLAIFKALSEGESSFKELVIVTSDGNHCSPCGACRQVLLEYAPNVKVIMIHNHDQPLVHDISELLPLAFDRQVITNNNLK